MESCKIVNRYCIKTAITTLHNQLQSANMSPSMVTRQLFYKVCVCKIPRLIVLLILASQFVHWQHKCSIMFYYTSVFVLGTLPKLFKISGTVLI